MPGECSVTCLPAMNQPRLQAHALICAMMLVRAASAAEFFTETFDSPSLGPNLEDIDSTYRFANGVTGVVAPIYRSYIRTVAADYLNRDFVAELTYSQTTGQDEAGVFFGLGTPIKNGQFFNEPVPAIFFLDLASDFGQRPAVAVRRWSTPGNAIRPEDVLAYQPDPGPPYYQGLVKVRLLKRGDRLRFDADLAYDSVEFQPKFSFETNITIAPFLTAENSHLFFGTGHSPTRFHEFTVSEAPRIPGALEIRVSEVELAWQSEVNTSYLVEFKTELPGAAWLPLTNCVPGDGKVLKLYDKVAPNDPKRFYRVTTNCVSGLR